MPSTTQSARRTAKRFEPQTFLRSTKSSAVCPAAPRRSTDDDDKNMQGSRIEFEAFEPWPAAVDGKALTVDMVKAVRSHVILSEHQALATALWIIHTHAVEVAEHTPRLQIKSPDDALREVDAARNVY